MADNEIIKALEDTICRIRNADTFIVPKEGIKNLCNGLEVVVDLINRQKAEIDILIRKKDTLRDEISELKVEVERLHIRNKTLSDITKNYDWKFEKAKSEAIKEFAERLKEKADRDFWQVGCYVDVEDIDNLVSEMMEGD